MMQISVSRGLVELNTLNDRIVDAVTRTFIGVSVGGKAPAGYESVDQMKVRLKANLQSALDLIERRRAIKSAIVLSNAGLPEVLPEGVTLRTVTIASKEMTVAEAIEFKNTTIGYFETLVKNMASQLRQAKSEMTKHNDNLPARLDQMILANFGSATAKVTKADEVDAMTKTFMNNNRAELVDPIGLETEIDKINNMIATFKAEVDFTLTDNNVLSKITIPDSI
jgi:hypothetical protein